MSLTLSALLLGGIVLLLAAAWVRGLARPEHSEDERATRHAHLRGLLALTSALLVGGLTLIPGLLGTSITAGLWYDAGLIPLLSPGLAASAGLLVIAAVPPLRSAAGARRQASLQPRRTLEHLRRRDRVLLVAAPLGVGAITLVAGMFSSPDEFGRYRNLSMSAAGVQSSVGPYPGWFYGLPALALALLLLLSALLALRRIARAPAPADGGEHAADLRQRGLLSRFVARLTAAGTLGITAFLLLMAGRASLSLAMNTTEHTAAALGTGAVITLLAGVLALLAAIASLATALGALRSTPAEDLVGRERR